MNTYNIQQDTETITYEQCHLLWEKESTRVHSDTSERIVNEVSEHIRSVLELNKDDVLLNVGCGDGLFDKTISSYVNNLIGVDWSAQKISVAKENRGGGRC